MGGKNVNATLKEYGFQHSIYKNKLFEIYFIIIKNSNYYNIYI